MNEEVMLCDKLGEALSAALRDQEQKVREESAAPTNDCPVVYCCALGDAIPVEVCEREQIKSTCEGCNASTRRCVKCGDYEIKDVVAGRCGHCPTTESASELTSELTDDEIRGLLETVAETSRGLRANRRHNGHSRPVLEMEVLGELVSEDMLDAMASDSFLALLEVSNAG